MYSVFSCIGIPGIVFFYRFPLGLGPFKIYIF